MIKIFNYYLMYRCYLSTIKANNINYSVEKNNFLVQWNQCNFVVWWITIGTLIIPVLFCRRLLLQMKTNFVRVTNTRAWYSHANWNFATVIGVAWFGITYAVARRVNLVQLTSVNYLRGETSSMRVFASFENRSSRASLSLVFFHLNLFKWKLLIISNANRKMTICLTICLNFFPEELENYLISSIELSTALYIGWSEKYPKQEIRFTKLVYKKKAFTIVEIKYHQNILQLIDDNFGSIFETFLRIINIMQMFRNEN